MSGKHRARSLLRSVTTALAATAAAGATIVAVEAPAGATTPPWLISACEAAAVYVQAPTPAGIATANPQASPCQSDVQSVVSASATVIPGLLGIGTTKVTVGTATSRTHEGYNSLGDYYVTASADIASLTLSGPGVLVRATGIHSDSTVVDVDGAMEVASNAWLASLTVNGVAVAVQKNRPLTIPLGLRTSITFDNVTSDANSTRAQALFVTFPDRRYLLGVSPTFAALYDIG